MNKSWEIFKSDPWEGIEKGSYPSGRRLYLNDERYWVSRDSANQLVFYIHDVCRSTVPLVKVSSSIGISIEKYKNNEQRLIFTFSDSSEDSVEKYGLVIKSIAVESEKFNGVALFAKIQKELQEWTEFLKDNTKTLSQSELIGFWGELYVISHYIMEDHDPLDSIRYWAGPSGGKKDITLKIPELDILASILSEEKNNLKSVEGLVNLAVLNNFFQFNFIKEKNIIIKKGFIRNNLVISSYEGEISIKPHFQFNLNVEPSKLNIKKLFLIIQKNFFLEDSQGFEVIKKINGVLNFKTIFQGSIVFKNKEILFQNIKIGRTTPIIFDAKISQLGKKKIEFNVLKNIQYKENHTKELKISGFIVPSSSKVVFEQILFDKKILTDIETKGYEERFKNVVIKNSLNNLFDESKLDDFFKNIVN